jgi:hypothetical protein
MVTILIWSLGGLTFGFSYFSVWLIIYNDHPKIYMWFPIIPMLFAASILMSFTFCGIYWQAEQIDPNAFVNAKDEGDFMYFSIVTQSTVGFGDIYPKSPHARFLVCMQLFLSHVFNLIIFGVVGTHVAQTLLKKTAVLVPRGRP